MRKKLLKVVCAAAVLAMAFSFVGCGKDDSSSGSSSDTKKESSVDKDDDKDSSSSALYDSVEDYVNSSELQSQLSSLKSSIEGSGMTIELKAEDNVLIYEYTYESLVKADVTEDALAQLENGLEQQSATFELVADSLKEATNEKNPVVRVIYIGSDGEIIAQKDFSSTN